MPENSELTTMAMLKPISHRDKMESIQLLRVEATPASLAASAIEAVIEGHIDPLIAYANVTKMERAIEAFKGDERVRDMVMERVTRDGKVTLGDTLLEVVESGVRYDFSECGDDELNELMRLRADLDNAIKERQKMLRSLPISGMADPNTGAMVYPPSRTSKTTIKTTIK